jgi:hypothetical protein
MQDCEVHEFGIDCIRKELFIVRHARRFLYYPHSAGVVNNEIAFYVNPQLRITAKKDSGQAGMTRPGFADFSVIDPKIPLLTLTLSPKGRGDRISPPLRGGDKGEGDIFMLLCEPLAHVDSRNPECFREVGNPSESPIPTCN